MSIVLSFDPPYTNFSDDRIPGAKGLWNMLEVLGSHDVIAFMIIWLNSCQEFMCLFVNFLRHCTVFESLTPSVDWTCQNRVPNSVSGKSEPLMKKKISKFCYAAIQVFLNLCTLANFRETGIHHKIRLHFCHFLGGLQSDLAQNFIESLLPHPTNVPALVMSSSSSRLVACEFFWQQCTQNVEL